jgi:phosphoribosylglycinamide formyltransferase-1
MRSDVTAGGGPKNVAVLASGSGTNLESLIVSQRGGDLGPARLVVVGVNVPDCRALERARAAGLPTFVLDHRAFPSRDQFDQALLAALAPHAVDLIVLAGFMRLLGADFLARYRGRVINIHPALLPAFPGVHGQRQAFAYGVKISGCTVHFVDGGVDSGAVIAQAAVPVLDDDDDAALSARILAEEHRLLPAVVRALAEGRVSAEGRRVRVAGASPAPTAALRSV